MIEYDAFTTESFVAHVATEIFNFLMEMLDVIAQASSIGKLFLA